MQRGILMDYSGSPFSHAYARFVKAGHTPFIYRVIAAIVYAMVTLVIAQGIPLTVPQYAWIIPDFWSSGTLGACYLYTLLTTYCLFFWRVVETDLFSYREIETGSWDFVKKSGGSVRTLLWAKYFSQIIPPMFTYLLGAVITLGSVYLIFPDPSVLLISAACIGVGAMSLLILVSLESIFAALGIKKLLLSVIVLIIAFALLYCWNYWGFLKFTSETLVREAIHRVYDLKTPLMPAIAAASLLLSLIVCTTVPGGRIVRYDIEKMDEDALEKLQLEPGLEIFEKSGENFELLYSPSPEPKKKK